MRVANRSPRRVSCGIVTLRRSIGLRFAGMAVAAIAQAICFVVLARWFGPEDFGVFAACVAAGVLLYNVLGFGLTPLLLRTGESREFDPVRSLAVSLRLAIAVLIGSGIVIAGSLASAPDDVVFVAAAIVIGDAMTDVCQAALAGSRRIVAATILLVVYRSALLLGVLAAVMTASAAWVIVAVVVMTGVNVVLVVRARPRWGGAVGLIRSSRGYWATNLASAITQLEVPVIAALGGASLAGNYAAGARTASPVNLLGRAILQVVTPELARDPDTRVAMFARVRRAMNLMIGVGILVALPAGWLMTVLLGSGYEAAWAPAAGFVCGGVIMGANQAYQAYFLAAGRPAVAARAVAVGALAGVASAAGLAVIGGLPWLGLVPIIAQGTMQLLFRRWISSV